MRKGYRKFLAAGMLLCLCLATGCGKKEAEETEQPKQKSEESQKKEEAKTPEKELDIQEEETEPEEPAGPPSNGITIVIDPGHSSIVEGGMEPVGPGAEEYKSADTYGTSGISTGIPEYEFTLNVGNKLKAELEARGYTIVMTRDSNDVPRSCIERAEIMNGANASACVRIHANGSENQEARGAMTICTTPSNPYVPQLYEQSRRLSDCVLNRLVEATGCISEGVWETDTMSGNNWSQIPVTIVETGYMTNPEEDVLLASEEYQNQIVQGIANGIDEFMQQ